MFIYKIIDMSRFWDVFFIGFYVLASQVADQIFFFLIGKIRIKLKALESSRLVIESWILVFRDICWGLFFFFDR